MGSEQEEWDTAWETVLAWAEDDGQDDIELARRLGLDDLVQLLERREQP